MLYDQAIALETPTRAQPQPRQRTVTIEVVHDVDRTEWNQLLSEDPRSTFFHTVEWGESLERAVEGWERYYILANVDGRLAAGLPAMKYHKNGFSAVMSMPFGTYGGPVLGDEATSATGEDLCQRFYAEARAKRIVFAEIVDLSANVSVQKGSDIRQIEDETQVLHLNTGFDELMSNFRPANRNKIRKAQKAGVTVRRGRRRDDFLRYRNTLLECSKNWGGRIRFDQKFFETLSNIDNGSVQLWLAEHNGNVVAGLLNFMHGNNVMNWGAVMMRSSRLLSPMNLLHAEAIRDAVNRGLKVYNFGSSLGFNGVHQFKTTFGTTRVQYHHYVLQKKWFALLKRWARRRKR